MLATIIILSYLYYINKAAAAAADNNPTAVVIFNIIFMFAFVFLSLYNKYLPLYVGIIYKLFFVSGKKSKIFFIYSSLIRQLNNSE